MKVILEYHGSDLRLTPYELREYYERILDNIVVSTPDLLEYSTTRAYEWLPLIIDTEHFKSTSHKRGALFIKPHDQELPPTDTPYNIAIVYRDVTPWTYSDMPKLFEKYSVYVDIRMDKNVGLVKPISKTALEALSTGMEVYTSDRLLTYGLPECFKPENVIREAEEIYS